MNAVQTEEQSIKIKKMESLYHKRMSLGKEAQAKGEYLLAESYYQHAEHYLQVMNELKSNLPTSTTIKKSSSAIIKGIIKDLKLERTPLKDASGTYPKLREVHHNGVEEKLNIVPDDLSSIHSPAAGNEKIRGPKKYYLRRFASRKDQDKQAYLAHDKDVLDLNLDSLSLK